MHAVVLLLLISLLACAKTRVRQIADVTVGGGRYTVQANSDGEIILTAKRGAAPVTCWMTPKEESSWLRSQRSTIDSVPSASAARVEIDNGNPTERCNAHLLQVARAGASEFFLVLTGVRETDRVMLQTTRQQADTLLAQIELAAKAAGDLSPTAVRGVSAAQAKDSFVPPPPPPSVRGFHFSATFELDEYGRVLSHTMTATPDTRIRRRT